MAVPFSLREIDGQEVLPDAQGRFEVWGQKRYWLKLREAGDAVRMRELWGLPASVFERIEADRGILNFKNQVGSVRILGAEIHVRSHKLAGDAFAVMLRDISRSLAALPFDFNAPTFLPYEVGDADAPAILYHRWLMLSAWIEGSEAFDSLAGALGKILRDPHRRVSQEAVEAPTASVRIVSPDNLIAILTRPQALVPLPSHARLAQTTMGQRLRARPDQPVFPETVITHRMRLELDNPENRFVKYVLRVAQDLNERFHWLVAGNSGCLNPDLEARAELIAAGLAEALALPFFAEIGDMQVLPTQSMVLQRRDGYRDFLQGYSRLEARLRFPLAPTDLGRMLEAKDIAKLYETWCYFRVADALTELLGAPESALVIEPDDFRATMARETRLTWRVGGAPLTLCYDRSFKGRTAGGSYSVTLRPDITLEWRGERLLFDAKFKLDGVQWDEEQPDITGAGATRDDLYKMHAYREAIAGVTSAFVLYPGPSGGDAFFPRWTGEGLPRVGAIALRPQNPMAGGTLLRLLARIVGLPDDAGQTPIIASSASPGYSAC